MHDTRRNTGRTSKRARPRYQTYVFACARGLLPALLIALAYCNTFGFDLAVEPALPTSQPRDLWLFFPIGYLFTVAIETPVLLVGLTKQVTFRQRLFAGLWLTACTYPIVVLVLPILFADATRARYLLVAEVFAPVAECALFWLAFRAKLNARPQTGWRNFAAIILANLLSFIGGELLNATRWFGLF